MMPKASRFASSPYLVLMLGICLLLSACGNAGQSGAQPSAATTAPTSQDDNGGYGYGNGNTSVTPTPTTQISGPVKDVSILSESSGYSFNPATLTIAVGTTVTWTNLTKSSHTVTSDDGKSFDSSINTPLATNATYSFKFTKPGRYAYHCSFHSSMKAVIVVQ